MDKTATRAQELRRLTMRDAVTGRLLEKPTAPAMREVIKGAWNYGEAPREVKRPGNGSKAT